MSYESRVASYPAFQSPDFYRLKYITSDKDLGIGKAGYEAKGRDCKINASCYLIIYIHTKGQCAWTQAGIHKAEMYIHVHTNK